MDDFVVETERGNGTMIRMTKWRLRDELELLRERRRALDATREGGQVSDGVGP
jgi:transcriptional regulator CtsR